MTTDNLTQYEAICDSYKNMPITTLVVLQELLNVENTKEWFAGTDIFHQILEKLKEENK